MPDNREDALPGHEHGLDPKPEWQPRYPGSGRLQGKVAVITGGDSGIGRAVAALFAREGADLDPAQPLWRGGPEKVRHFGQSTPMVRAGQPNEVAPAFLFLACEDSSYMSGQVLHPNGGIIING